MHICLCVHEIGFNCSTKVMTERFHIICTKCMLTLSKFVFDCVGKLKSTWICIANMRLNLKAVAHWERRSFLTLWYHCLFYRITYYSCNSFTIVGLNLYCRVFILCIHAFCIVLLFRGWCIQPIYAWTNDMQWQAYREQPIGAIYTSKRVDVQSANIQKL